MCLFSLVLVQDTAHYFTGCLPTRAPSRTGWSPRPPSLTGWSPRPPSFTGWSPRPPSLPHRMEYTATLSYMMEKANPYHRMSVHQGRAATPPSTRCLASHELSCLLAQGRMSAYNYPLAQLAQDVSPSTQHALLSSQDWPRSSQDWPRSSHQNELCPCWV